MKLATIFTADRVLSSIMPDNIDYKLYYRICKISGKMTTHVRNIEKVRIGLVRKYSKKDKDGQLEKDKTGQNYIIKDQEKMDKDFEKFLEEDVIFEFELIPYEMIKQLKIPAGQMAMIMDFIEEPNAEN